MGCQTWGGGGRFHGVSDKPYRVLQLRGVAFVGCRTLWGV